MAREIEQRVGNVLQLSQSRVRPAAAATSSQGAAGKAAEAKRSLQRSELGSVAQEMRDWRAQATKLLDVSPQMKLSDAFYTAALAVQKQAGGVAAGVSVESGLG